MNLFCLTKAVSTEVFEAFFCVLCSPVLLQRLWYFSLPPCWGKKHKCTTTSSHQAAQMPPRWLR